MGRAKCRTAGSAAVIALALALAGCGSSQHAALPDQPTHENATRSALAQQPPSALSGRPGGSNGPVLFAKIDNTKAGHPQVGVDAADVVYIEEVEGGLTRLAAVFSSQIPPQIGPVRSARIGDVELMRQYGQVGLVYSGANAKLQPTINQADLVDLGVGGLPGAYHRQAGRHAPYNLMVSGPDLAQAALKRHVDRARSVGFTFGPAPQGGQPAGQLDVRFMSTHVQFRWNQASARWELVMNGTTSRTPAGDPLGGTTVIVQQVSMQTSGFNDVNGAPTPQARTVGQGKAWIARDGQVWQGKWRRDSATAGTQFSVDGQRMPLAAGQVWVVLAGTGVPVTSTP